MNCSGRDVVQMFLSSGAESMGKRDGEGVFKGQGSSGVLR